LSEWLGRPQYGPPLPDQFKTQTQTSYPERPDDVATGIKRDLLQMPLRMTSHPRDNAPAIVGTVATMFAPEIKILKGFSQPVIGAAKYAFGSLTGSAVKETPDVLAGKKDAGVAIQDAATEMGWNTASQYVGEKVLGGLMKPRAGTDAAHRAQVFREAFPNVLDAPPVSASTILGPSGNIAARIAGALEKIASLFPGGADVAAAADKKAAAQVTDKLTGEAGMGLPLPPKEATGLRLQDNITRTGEAGLAAEQARVDTQRGDISALANKRRQEIQRELDAVRAANPDAVTPPNGWSSPTSVPPNPVYAEAQKAAQAELDFLREAEAGLAIAA
jgi:hypothetical protein